MSWTFKIAFALIGLVLFRFRWQGLLVGLVFGHLVDLGRARRPPPPPPEPPPGAFAGDDPYGVLAIAPSASDAEVEAAFRRLIGQYHPDRVANAAPEIRELAERRARDINAAYERIQRIRRG
jgi:DnaJ-domain-containing protein 1